MPRQTIAIISVFALSAAVCFGVTWHVPGEVATIQAALDSTRDGDTVLVEVGTYNEALQAPAHTFALLGVISEPDSEMAVIDPTPLEGSNHLACLTLRSLSRAVIRDFVFRNGRGMWPREHYDDVGGIANTAADLRIEHCLFDSTYTGVGCALSCQRPVTISDCQFILNSQGCVWDRSPARTSLINCDFSWHGEKALWLADSALVENCRFHDQQGPGEWIWLEGYGITVRGCTFGPTTNSVNDIIWTSNLRAFTFEQNTVQDADVWFAIVEFHGGIGNDTTYFRNNVFRRTHAVVAAAGGAGISIITGENMTVPVIFVTDNIFDSCQAPSPDGFGSIHMGPVNVRLSRNLFTGPSTPGPAVRKWQVDTLVVANSYVHNCSFNHTGTALKADRWYFNVVSNWWSDSSGPYYAGNHPEGQGDTIIGRWVDFDPWLTEDPLIESAPTPDSPVPSNMRLVIYPNPFNATATFFMTVDRPAEYEVELYNLLGQCVERLWSGTIVKEQRITMRAGDLGSGIYFARLRQSATNKTTALAKLVLLK